VGARGRKVGGEGGALNLKKKKKGHHKQNENEKKTRQTNKNK